MHKQWEEMIPFYVARTLAPMEVVALEKHLTECESCRLQLEEWRMIASAVWTQAARETHELPPLSLRVRHEVNQDTRRQIPIHLNGHHNKIIPLPQRTVRKHPSRSLVVPVTLVAAVATVLLIGGVILYMMFAEPSAEEPTNVAAMSAQGTQTVTGSPTQPIIATTEDDMGIFATPTAFPLPSASPESPPAVSQRSPAIGLGGGAPGTDSNPELVPNDPLDMSSSSVQSVPSGDGLCYVWNNTRQIINIYDFPGIQYEVVEIMEAGVGLEANVQNANGWYQVLERGRGIIGWVDGSLVTVNGDCNNVPAPTPTNVRTPITNAPTTCLAQGDAENDAVNLFAGPGEGFEILNTMSPQTSAEVVARSDNDWYQVAYTIYGRIWDGWVRANEVRLYRQCDTLPEIASQGYVPLSPPSFATQVIPVPSSTPLTTTGDVVHFTVTPQTAAPGETVSLRWETRNVTSVWIEYHGTNSSPIDNDFQPMRLYSDLSPTGTLVVRVPENYPHSEIRFNLIVGSYNRAGRQAGETAIILVEG